MAVSVRWPGVLWSHNDSGEPMVFAVSASGPVKGIRVTGARSGDWEASSVGKCPGGSCVYIGDIGDNDGKRRAITFYRFPEPATDAAATATAETMQATYPDRPQDAEAMLVMPDGAMFVVTKGEQAPVGVYRVPSGFQNGATVQLARVATVELAAGGNGGKGVANDGKVTGASASPDGRWVVLRTRGAVTFYAAADFTAGRIREAYRFNLSSAAEPQGEGIGFGTGGVLWLASEGGGKSRPGLLTRAECALP